MIDTLYIFQYSDPYDSDEWAAENSLFNRDEDAKEKCDVCGEEMDEEGYFNCGCYSPCCGARMMDDNDICPDCKEHV